MKQVPASEAEQALMRNALAVTAFFGHWSPELVAQVVKGSHLRYYERGDPIDVGSGDGRQALAVVSGSLEVSHVSKRGDRFVVGVIGAGRVTGMVRLFSDLPVEYGYTAWERSVVAHLFCAHVLEALELDPSRWRDVTKDFLTRHAEQVGTLLDQVLGPPELRIAATLQRLSLLFGVEEGPHLRLRLRLSQEDLAAMLCISRQTVSKEMKRLAADGVVTSTYKTVTILDRDALAKLVNSER